MKENSSSIPITRKTALGFIYLYSNNHEILWMKNRIISDKLKELHKHKHSTYEDREGNNIMKELLRIEIICTTVHYAEVFASVLIAMKKQKGIHKFLQEYKISDIREFYEKIPKRRKKYIVSLLQIPDPNNVQNENLKKDIELAIEQAQIELHRLAKFYLKWTEFYNSYKHGLRFFTSWPDEKSNDTMTGYFTKGSISEFKVVLPQKSVDEAEALTSFMFSLLDNARNTFRQLKLEKKKNFTVQIFRSPRSKLKFSNE